MKPTKGISLLFVTTLLIAAPILSSCNINSTISSSDSVNQDKCLKSYNSISPYLHYIGTPHTKGESIKLTQSEYDNLDNVEFMGMRGIITFYTRDGYISSCTWTSFNYYSENEYQTIANDLCVYFGTYTKVDKKSYSKGNTYHYHWADPYYGFDVTMAHGFSPYDPEGDIEIKWEINEHSCSIIGHTWLDATCTEPKTCKICDKTEGKALGHKGSELSEWDTDYDNATKIQEYHCTICDESIVIQSVPITTFVNGNRFTIHPAAFADRFEDSSSRLKNIDYYAKSEYDPYAFYDENNTIFYRIQDKNDDYKDIGMMSFSKPDGKTVAVMNNYTENCIGNILILIEDSWDVSAVVYSAILAIDPDISYSEAADVGQIIVDNINTDFDYNGINYLLYKDTKYHYLIISIASSV